MHIDLSRAQVVGAQGRTGLAGFAVGLMHIEAAYPLLPGNPQNASTFDFPVLYEAVAGADAGLVLAGAPEVSSVLIDAAQRLEAAGVGAIIGVCGSFAYFQPALARAVSIPVFSSILVQAEFVISALPHDRKLLIVFARASSDTPRLRQACGLVSYDRVVVKDCLGLSVFDEMIAGSRTFDVPAFRAQLLERVGEAVAADPSIGAIMLQCSELAPFASDLQKLSGLPVHDATLLVRWAHASLSRLPPVGLMSRSG